jgi:uncharacterized protein YjbI with pentapeptide repeats
MDRDEAIKLLKGGKEGVAEWNRRRERREQIPDLSGADVRGANLIQANLSGANLHDARLSVADLFRANLIGTDLSLANLRDANLREADLRDANLREAHLSGADLFGAKFNSAHLSGADLRFANLVGADLGGADPTLADLGFANLSGAHLNGATLTEAVCATTTFAFADLSEVKGLDLVKHGAPSSVGIDTLFRSRGNIPKAFLHGCGLTPWEILAANLYRPELNPVDFTELQYQIFDAWTKGRSLINGCFISYSWKDAKFVDKLRERLLAEGINVWLDRHDMVAGTIQNQVWRAIQRYHVVILALSKDSITSDWVENELDMARTKERAEGRAVLCPVALDDAWKSKVAAKDGPGDPSRQLWRTLQQKLVIDFTRWNTKAFGESFQKLLRGLHTNYTPG